MSTYRSSEEIHARTPSTSTIISIRRTSGWHIWRSYRSWGWVHRGDIMIKSRKNGKNVNVDPEQLEIGYVVAIEWYDVHAYERIELSEIDELKEPEATYWWGAEFRKVKRFLLIALKIGGRDSDGVKIEALPYCMIDITKQEDSWAPQNFLNQWFVQWVALTIDVVQITLLAPLYMGGYWPLIEMSSWYKVPYNKYYFHW